MLYLRRILIVLRPADAMLFEVFKLGESNSLMEPTFLMIGIAVRSLSSIPSYLLSLAELPV